MKFRAAKLNAYALRIWAFCEPRGWDVTVAEIAEQTGLNVRVVGRVLRQKGWTERTRAESDYQRRARRCEELGIGMGGVIGKPTWNGRF